MPPAYTADCGNIHNIDLRRNSGNPVTAIVMSRYGYAEKASGCNRQCKEKPTDRKLMKKYGNAIKLCGRGYAFPVSANI